MKIFKVRPIISTYSLTLFSEIGLFLKEHFYFYLVVFKADINFGSLLTAVSRLRYLYNINVNSNHFEELCAESSGETAVERELVL